MGKLRPARPISHKTRPFYLKTSQRTWKTTSYTELEQELDRLIESSGAVEEAVDQAVEHEAIEEPCNDGKKLRPARQVLHHRRQFHLRTGATTRYAELEQELDRLIESSAAVEEAVEPEAVEDPCNEGQKWVDSDFPELGDDSSQTRDLKLRDGLVMYFGDFGVPRAARDGILQLLREHGHPYLPTCSATLMKSPRSVKAYMQEVVGGEMYYSGIECGLRKTVTQDYLSACKSICLDIFWDGLSPYKSVKFKIWPILCRLSATEFSKESPPFIVAVFGGKKDPQPNVFLKDFIVEAKQLEKDGLIFNGVRYEVIFQKFIADYPARCRMKCVNGEGPSSLIQCERCTVKGKKRGGTTFTCADIRRSRPTLRTDRSFRERRQMEYHTHHRYGPREDSPFMQLSIDMCFSFPIDSMHVLYQGVMKTWWSFLVETKRGIKYHIVPQREMEISNYMKENFRESFPTEYARRVRGLSEWKLWKATEWRRFLLYDGILVGSIFFRNAVYRNFLLLSCAVRILSSPELIRKEGYLSDAHALLELFVRDVETKFGKQFMAVKAHSLTHLAKECERHGVLDSFSAFPFESYLSRINRAMSAHGRCLQQIVRRIREGHLLQPTQVSMLSHCSTPALSKEIGPSECLGSAGIEYLEVSLPGMVISTDRQRDSVVKTFDDEVIRVISLIHDTSKDEVFAIGYSFACRGDFFHWPIKSRAIGIEKVWGLNSVKKKWRIQSIKCKCVLLKIKRDYDEWLCLPQVHEESQFRSLQRNMAL